jgi:hypothetical protein
MQHCVVTSARPSEPAHRRDVKLVAGDRRLLVVQAGAGAGDRLRVHGHLGVLRMCGWSVDGRCVVAAGSVTPSSELNCVRANMLGGRQAPEARRGKKKQSNPMHAYHPCAKQPTSMLAPLLPLWVAAGDAIRATARTSTTKMPAPVTAPAPCSQRRARLSSGGVSKPASSSAEERRPTSA